jgi:hypothetical protein
MDDRGKDSVAQACAQILDGAHYAQLAPRVTLQAVEDTELGERGALSIAALEWTRKLDPYPERLAQHRPGRRLRLWIGGDVNREETTAKTAFSSAWKVDVALFAATEKVTTPGWMPGCSHGAKVGVLRLERA